MVTPALLPNAEMKPDVDFAAVVKISSSYNVLVTTSSLPVNSLAELVALLKSKPITREKVKTPGKRGPKAPIFSLSKS